jgi:hypothetical protein
MTVLGTSIAAIKWRGRELRTEVVRVRRPARLSREARQPERYLSQEEMSGVQLATDSLVGERGRPR